MTTQPRKQALVTGASAGIGAAYSRLLASRGYDLILTARRREKLVDLATELESAHHIETLVVTGDLALAETPAQIMEQIEAAGWQVDYLVNNAGYGQPGRYTGSEWDSHAVFMQVMVNAVLHLSHLALTGMEARGYGRIVNVASLAGLVPSSAGHTLYGASKSFLIKFSESLREEYRGTGIKVCAVCPGFTYSEFHDVNGTREQVSKMAGYMWQTAEQVVAEGYDATERGTSFFVTGRVNRAIAWLSRHLPRGLLEAAIRRQSRQFRNAD